VCSFVCLCIVCCVLNNDYVLGLTNNALGYDFSITADHVSS